MLTPLGLRSAQLRSPAGRTALANALVEAVGEARRGEPMKSGGSRSAQRCARRPSALLALASRLREATPIDVRGAAMVALLVNDGASPLHRAGTRQPRRGAHRGARRADPAARVRVRPAASPPSRRSRTDRGGGRSGRPRPGRGRRSARGRRRSSSKSKSSKFSLIRSGVDRLREDDEAALDVPAEHHLRGRAADPLGDLADRRVVEHLALRQRRPRLGRDAVLLVVGAHLAVLEVRVELDLVDGRDRRRSRRPAARGVDLEVGDADRAGAPVRLGTPRAPSRWRRSRRRRASAAANGSGTGRRSRSRAPRACRRMRGGRRRGGGRCCSACWSRRPRRDRGPTARIASPTSRSLPYISAVSMCR